MNRAYKLVWNSISGSWVVASELAKGRKKSSGKSLKVTVLLASVLSAGAALAAPAINALPTGESVVSGSATFDRTVSNQLTVNQLSSKLLSNWNSFDVGSGGKVIFAQPDASSIALNRVSSGNASEIFGQVTANGQLVIVNPNGITFGAGSQVSAASIIGSVLDISDTNFSNGTLLFSRGTATGSIDNQGSLIATAGSVSLLAPTVKNSGSITATAGNASLINADAVDLSVADPAITVASSITGLIQQSGTITAIQVSSVGGKILLTGDTSQSNSQIQLAGTLAATTNTNTNGRSILINGDVNLNGAGNLLDLTSSDGYSLTNAAAVNLNGTGSGFSVNGTAYTVIRDVNQLQAMGSNLAGQYVLANNIAASDTVNWNSGAGFVPVGVNSVTSFTGIFDGLGHVVNNLYINRPSSSYVGLFAYAKSATLQNIGVINATITGGQYTGILSGYLSAFNGDALINRAYSSGQLNSTDGYAGGLVGSVTTSANNQNAKISNSYSTANVVANNRAGGLVGYLGSNFSDAVSTIENSYATGNVSAGQYVGGLVGRMFSSAGSELQVIVQKAYASGAVSGTSSVGGLVGEASSFPVSILNSYWNVDSTGRASGVGVLTNSATASNLLGLNTTSAKQLSSYASWGSNIDDQGGTGNTWRIYEGHTAPLLRSFLRPVTAIVADSAKTYDGTSNASSSFSLTSPALNLLGTAVYVSDSRNAGQQGLGLSGLYSTQQGDDLIVDKGIITISKAQLSLSSSDVTKTYDGTIVANGTVVITSGELLGTDSMTGGTFVFDTKHAGTGKTVTTSAVDIHDGNSGGNYAVTYVDNSSSSIDKASLSISTSGVTKTYDGTTVAAGTAIISSGALFDTDSMSGGTFTFDTKHAGSGKTVRTSAVTVADGNNGGNYAVSYVDNSSSTIDKASLTLTTVDLTKTYDGTTLAAGTAVISSGALFDTDAISGGTFAFDTKHAGTGKTVTTSAVTVTDGNNGGNYAVSYVDNSSSTIDKASLTINSLNVSKTYDGTTVAAGTAVISSGGLFANDAISGGTFTFDTKHAGTGKTVMTSAVTVTDGNSGNNYAVSYADNTAGIINPASLVLKNGGFNKVYDGTAAAATSLSIVGGQLFAGDSYSGGVFKFLDRNVGSNKALAVAEGVLLNDGNNGDNYLVSYVPNFNNSISKASLVLSAGSVSKVYDGTTSASAAAVLTGGTQVFAGDSISGGTFTFDNRNAGTGKAVTVSGVTVSDGNNGGNYNVVYVDNTNSTINKRLLTISAVADSKVYDGKLTSTGKPVVVGRQRGDSIAGLTQSYLDKNAGTGKTINVDAGYVIRDGNNGNNYDVVLVDNHTGVITPKTLTISTVANSKVYDGGLTSASKPLVTGLLSGDRVTGLFQQYETKTVGENKQLLIKNGYVVQDGNGGSNYSVVQQTSQDGVIIAH